MMGASGEMDCSFCTESKIVRHSVCLGMNIYCGFESLWKRSTVCFIDVNTAALIFHRSFRVSVQAQGSSKASIASSVSWSLSVNHVSVKANTAIFVILLQMNRPLELVQFVS